MAERKNKGESKSRVYWHWNNMIARCYRPTDRRYALYGQKGIKVCDEWRDYGKFKKWAYSHGYEDGLSLERIDCSKGYSPRNCEWVPKRMQQLNKSNSIRVLVNLYLVEVCRFFSLPYESTRKRYLI